MSIYVKKDDAWSLSKEIWVKNNDVWVEPHEVYVNQNGVWKLAHKVIRFTGDAVDVNLFSVSGSPSSPIRLKAVINPGVSIYASSANTPALSISGFPAGSEILLVNNGTIIGAGGNGATGSAYGQGFVNSAQRGGTAVRCTNNVTIQNNGTLAGGGGGGGQGGWGSWSVTSSCFPAGTMVSTPTGLRPIEEIQVGDEVYAFDAGLTPGNLNPIFDSGLEARKVVLTSVHSFDELPNPLVKIIHKYGELVGTFNHEIQSSTRQSVGSDPGFAKLGDLQIGDIIYNYDGEQLVIEDIQDGPSYDLVYNLEVEEYHTYIASGIRVHNGGTTTTTSSKKGSTTTTYTLGGSGGGGGAGRISGSGGGAGAGGTYSGGAGSAGTSSAGGAGGFNPTYASRINSYGGAGGGLGQAGASGSGGSYWAGGGAAGRYIEGNSLVTWESTGTRLGVAE